MYSPYLIFGDELNTSVARGFPGNRRKHIKFSTRRFVIQSSITLIPRFNKQHVSQYIYQTLRMTEALLKNIVLLAKYSKNIKYSEIILLLTFLVIMCTGEDKYLQQRNVLLKYDEGEFSGAKLELTENEENVSRYLVKLKKNELREAYRNLSGFLPSKSFLMVKDEIEKSKVFKFIKKIPKGASLHTHMLAGVSAEYIIQNFSYMENVYGCYNSYNIFKLKVMLDPGRDANCSWKSLKTYRKEFAEQNLDFDAFLKDQLVLGYEAVVQSRAEVWAKFKNTFSTIYDLVAYRPIFEKYIYQLLNELYQDNVLYTELRGTFMPLYDLNGTTYDTKVFLDVLRGVEEDFKKSHPQFIGVKYIYSIYRGVDNSTLKENLEQLIYFRSLYPDFIAGLDFVGLEEEGRKLVDFHHELAGLSNDLQFFFHAGETNQFGGTDENLADAILMNSSRIGHGFALTKHPKLFEVARKKDIAIELCPISNQVLKLNEDPRNHPATILLSTGYPLVICNDDPSAWEATGLSYDWYIVFMSMTWEDHGLKVLKKFAQDSLKYSVMTQKERTRAWQTWNEQWGNFIEEISHNIAT